MSSFDDSFKRAMAAAKPGPRNETEKDDTSIWAVVAGGNAIFAGLRTGTHFRFPRSAATEVLTKASGGWYVDQRGQRFRTGAKTAVIELEKAITVGSSHTAQVRTPRAFLGEEIRYPIEINPVTNKGERKPKPLSKPAIATMTSAGLMVGTTPVKDPDDLASQPTLARDQRLGELKFRTSAARIWVDSSGIVTVEWPVEPGHWNVISRYKKAS